MVSLSYLFEGLLSGFEFNYTTGMEVPINSKKFSKNFISKLEKDLQKAKIKENK